MGVFPLLSTKRNFFSASEMEEICASLIVFSVRNPGNISAMWREQELSLHVLKNRYESDKNTLAGTYQNNLKNAIGRYFPSQNLSVVVDTEDVDVNLGTYKLIIKVEYNGTPIITHKTISVEENGTFKLIL